MKRLMFWALAAFMIAACAEDVINEQGLQPIVDDAPETLTVGFEENDTRVQLNEETKTVWTKGDLVSVFYRSDANQKWQYQGETGERIGNLKCVDAGTATRDMDRVVVVYPYSGDYYINPSTFNVQATLPATQTYLKDSYGVGCNLMVSQSEFTQFSLKSVCGWLKLQLTGNGKVVKSIKFCGNNGEQVAGLIYVDTYTAESTLALEVGNNGGGNLIFDDTILTEVTLDCGEGVTLGAEATEFYIALPPQTFTEGFTVEVNCEGYSPMTISTSNKVVIERNHIQPMAAKEHDAEEQIPNNEIWYTATTQVEAHRVYPWSYDTFGATITSHEYDSTTGIGIITFESSVTTIGDKAFYGCSSLTSITIPDSVTTIGDSAFYYCYGLTSITIPNGVTSIGEGAFNRCSCLTSITVPDSVTTIGDLAFSYCLSLTSITIPDSVTTIGWRAFHYCYRLTEFRGKFAEDNGRILVVDDTLIAFANACGTTEYTIPNSVTVIGDSAFYYCSNLTSVTIPNSVTTIEDSAFSSCGLTSVTIPNSVTTIGDNAFYSCDSLTSVTIGDSVTTIGNNAFWYCLSLTSVTIGNNVTTIGDNAFYNCSSLTSVTIPNSVTIIGDGAFYKCARLTSVTIGDGVTTIGREAFYYCYRLTEFRGKFAEDNGRILVVDDTLIAFALACGATEYTIPNSVTAIGDSAFAYCSSLTSVTIPNSVTAIGDNAFYTCSLTSVAIGDSVTTIGRYAFCSCNGLKSVYCKPATPPSGSNDMFGYNASDRKIYVPTESVAAYKAASYWKGYANYIVGYDF